MAVAPQLRQQRLRGLGQVGDDGGPGFFEPVEVGRLAFQRLGDDPRRDLTDAGQAGELAGARQLLHLVARQTLDGAGSTPKRPHAVPRLRGVLQQKRDAP